MNTLLTILALTGIAFAANAQEIIEYKPVRFDELVKVKPNPNAKNEPIVVYIPQRLDEPARAYSVVEKKDKPEKVVEYVPQRIREATEPKK